MHFLQWTLYPLPDWHKAIGWSSIFVEGVQRAVSAIELSLCRIAEWEISVRLSPYPRGLASTVVGQGDWCIDGRGQLGYLGVLQTFGWLGSSGRMWGAIFVILGARQCMGCYHCSVDSSFGHLGTVATARSSNAGSSGSMVQVGIGEFGCCLIPCREYIAFLSTVSNFSVRVCGQLAIWSWVANACQTIWCF